ncbi:MAG: hypothetical protein U9Q82_14745 [Chloroflexota bacterium]|nr:hypothetical protein [Chloroflexota bacterium]
MFRAIRQRFGKLIWAVVGSVFALGCGLLFLLVLAPKQKAEARRLERLPLMDVQFVSDTSAGAEILISGRLQGERLIQSSDLIAYELDQWEVTQPDSDDGDDQPQGSWEQVELVVPDMQLSLAGGQLSIHRRDGVSLSGPLREEWLYASNSVGAEYEGEWLAEGSRRYLGFYNDDLVTVWGQKASADGVIPDELYAGDRVAFVQKKHDNAKGMLIAGISMLICSPVVLVGGALSALFGRRR